MKINWVAPHFYPETGGVETHVEQISNRLIKRGHEVVVHTSSHTVTNKELPKTGKLGDIQIKRYKPTIKRSFYLTKFKPEIREGDIIAMEGYPNLTNDYIRKRYSKEFPLVIYIQGVVLPLSGFAAFQKKFYDSFFGIKTLKRVDRLIAMTQLEKDWCQKKGIDTKKIEIIPNGISDLAFQKYDSDLPKQKFRQKRYLLFIGRMYHEKAPLHLVQALSKLHDDHKDLGVIFIGPDQGEVEKVKALARKLGLKDRIVYAGKVTEKEKYELLSGCEFFVLPSKFEAQGIVFIEAWAQKKPVVGTRVGGVPYVVADGETGLLYEYGDIDALTAHIRFLLENPGKARAMGERGFEIADTKSRWKSVIDRIESLYLSAVQNFKKK
ncbi:MAG: glycosyltransferase family 4 protein [Thermoplasmata archaeon]|nr:MAG: glycosyltransferase family 4 protein [Thermoplasmata archaeon]